MLIVKYIGILFLCSIAAADMITFKPFLKSRYSLRGRRAKSTTKAPLTKSNETVLNYLSTEPEIQSSSTLPTIKHLETTTLFTEKLDSMDHSTGVNKIATEPATTITTTTKLVELPVIEVRSNTTLARVENNVSESSSVPETSTTMKMETTTQAEWVYDYYASDDESQKKK